MDGAHPSRLKLSEITRSADRAGPQTNASVPALRRLVGAHLAHDVRRWRGIGRKAETEGDPGRLDPRVDAQLAEDVRHMDARRLRADEQGFPDLAVRPAARDESQDLGLAIREPERLRRPPGDDGPGLG